MENNENKYYEDDIWKEIIEELFPEFVSFFMPELYESIDFTKEKVFLDKELNKLFPESEEKRRRTDKLAKVFLKNGKEKWLLFHIEIQGYDDKEFEKRMFSYYYRIYDKYQKEITALAVFTEGKKDYKPNKFEKESFGTKLSYEYNTYKILEQDSESLRTENNIFSLVVLAALYSLKSRNNDDKRLNFKLELTKLLFEKDYPIEKIKGLFKFINILLKLTDDLKKEIYYEEVNKMTVKDKRVELLSDYDEVLIKKTKEKVEKDRDKEIAKKLKNSGVDINIIINSTGLSKEEIEKL